MKKKKDPSITALAREMEKRLAKGATSFQKIKKKVTDPRYRAKIQKEVERKYAQNRRRVEALLKKLQDPAVRRRLKSKWRESKIRLQRLKVQFKESERKAKLYTKKNPGKALAFAAAAGAAVGYFVKAFRNATRKKQDT